MYCKTVLYFLYCKNNEILFVYLISIVSLKNILLTNIIYFYLSEKLRNNILNFLMKKKMIRGYFFVFFASNILCYFFVFLFFLRMKSEINLIVIFFVFFAYEVQNKFDSNFYKHRMFLVYFLICFDFRFVVSVKKIKNEQNNKFSATNELIFLLFNLVKNDHFNHKIKFLKD